MHVAGSLSGVASDLGVYADHSAGLARYALIGRAQGSPHQAMTVGQLNAGGRVDRHLHAFEKGIYVLEGSLAVNVAGKDETLGPDDYCFIEYGVPHAFANPGGQSARWFEVCAPAPGGDLDDTMFVDAGFRGADAKLPFRRGHFDLAVLPPPSSAIGLVGFGAANVGGAALKVIMEREFGPSQFNLMVVQYGEGGFITEHDHAFEEGFFFLAGEIEAVLDGRTYRLKAGDYCWSAVGSMHIFRNPAKAPVRWLETQVPQPPARHQARFKADWARLISGG